MDQPPSKRMDSATCQLSRLLEQIAALRAELDAVTTEEPQRVQQAAMSDALRTCEAAIEMALAQLAR